MSGWDSQMEALIQEAKGIIDSEDGHEELWDFVLRIAGMDGDPNYQLSTKVTNDGY